MLRLPLHVILCALLGTAASSARAESPTAPEIVDDYIETQVVDSEFAYLSLKRFRGGELLDEKRLLAMTRKDQGKRASLMRLTRPEDLEGVTTLFLDQPSRQADVYLYMPEIGEAKQVKGKTRLEFEDIGDQEVKNIAEPVRAYRLVASDVAVAHREQRKRRGQRRAADAPHCRHEQPDTQSAVHSGHPVGPGLW